MTEGERIARLETGHADLRENVHQLRGDVQSLGSKIDRVAELDQEMKIAQTEMAGNIKLLVQTSALVPDIHKRLSVLETDKAKREGAGEIGSSMGKGATAIAAGGAGSIVGWLLNHFFGKT
jgi:predicted nuclease with TOPRIM domain